MLKQGIFNDFRFQLIHAGRQIQDRVLALFVDKYGHVTKLQIRVDDHHPRGLVI